ncbi:hypothetical protein GCM10010211_27710 [Streptomyces albospinus]|uniref:Uncharacterized protein n=1 Tax=Streptomyces albospinus TaxID=285515 RepID=A0ABQ2V178_9ACTN|nr:hypothetical protein GCM10010211_27710 [Streptomyces albospinus]
MVKDIAGGEPRGRPRAVGGLVPAASALAGEPFTRIRQLGTEGHDPDDEGMLWQVGPAAPPRAG